MEIALRKSGTQSRRSRSSLGGSISQRKVFDRSGVMMARSRICCAASIYRSIKSGGMNSVSPLVSKPEPPVPSFGKQLGDVVVHAQQVANRVVILAAIQAAQRHRSGIIAHRAGGLPQAVVDPGGDAEAIVFGELGFDRRHGAVAQLRGDVPPKSAIGLDILDGGRFEKVDAILRIVRVVAGGAVLRQDRTDGVRELVRRSLLGSRGRSHRKHSDGADSERSDVSINHYESHYHIGSAIARRYYQSHSELTGCVRAHRARVSTRRHNQASMRVRLPFLTLAAASMLSAANPFQPVISPNGVVNGASYLSPSFANYGIARGSLFIVFGSALGPGRPGTSTVVPSAHVRWSGRHSRADFDRRITTPRAPWSTRR